MATDAPTADDLLNRMNSIAPPSSGAASPPAAQSSAPSSDDLLRRMNAIAPPQQTTTTTTGTTDGTLPYAPPLGTGVRNVANAFVGGIYTAGANLASNLGMTPNALPSDVQTTMAAHPYVTGAGNLLGQATIGLPIGIGAGVVAPMVGLGADLGGAIATGGAAGAVQNLLSGDPSESWYQRAGTGALEGAVLGGVTHKVFDWMAPSVAAVGRETAAEVPATDQAWIGDTKQRVDQLLQEHAALGGPDSLSAAATPPEQATLSPAQVKAYRRVSELNQVASPIHGEDNTEYVSGSAPTQAERMGDPVISQQETLLRQRVPDRFEGPNGALTQNNAARVRAFDETNIGDVRAADLDVEQKAAAQRDGARFLAQSGPVDATDAAAWAKTQLANPRIQENPEVYNTIKDLNDRLYDANGNLKTDPEAFWGMHDRLQNMLQKAKDPLNASSNEKFSVSQINDFKQLVDGAMDKASNGAWRTFLDNQADFLKQKNAYNLLNTFRNKGMLKSDGTINANNFHRFVTDLAIRRGKPGIDPAMDVPDDVMQRLINIDSDLKRASRIDLGKARGSPTNLFYTLARGMGIGAAHAIVGSTGLAHGGVGNIMLQQGIRSAEEKLGAWRMNRLVRNALAPPPGGLTPPPGNPLSH